MTMKLIIAIVQPNKLDDVMDALDEKEIYLRTVNNVLGCGRQKGIPEVYRGVIIRKTYQKSAARNRRQ